MTVLNIRQKTSILRCLVEGNSLRSTARITGHARETVTKLLISAGEVCKKYQFMHFKAIESEFIQVDEIWAFVGCKQKTMLLGKNGLGDVWTWVAMDTQSKLVIYWVTGGRTPEEANELMRELYMRVSGRFQLTTDGYKSYADAVEESFHGEIDFAMAVKKYQGKRYDSTKKIVVSGEPIKKKISTSMIERQNLTMRMGMRRFTRKTNAFSKKLDNHKNAISLHFFYYNFVRIHKTIKTTPALKSGISKSLWELEDLAKMIS